MTADILKFAISILTAGGAITVILGYLGKQLIEHLNKRELERAKNEFSRELESHKSQLSLVNIHQSKLYDKRAEVITTMYSNFYEFYSSMVDLTVRIRPVDPNDRRSEDERVMERLRFSSESGQTFLDYYNSNKIFFTKDLCAKIDKLIKLLNGAHSDVMFPYIFGVPPSEMTSQMFKDASEKIRNEGADIKEEIEDEFRIIMGTVSSLLST